jgi:hypothetical protein
VKTVESLVGAAPLSPLKFTHDASVNTDLFPDVTQADLISGHVDESKSQSSNIDDWGVSTNSGVSEL